MKSLEAWLAKMHKKVDLRYTDLLSRGTRTRTQNKGFGDPRVTITPYPYALRATFDIIAGRKGIVKP